MNKQTTKIITEYEFIEFINQISNTLDGIEKGVKQDNMILLNIINEIEMNKK